MISFQPILTFASDSGFRYTVMNTLYDPSIVPTMHHEMRVTSYDFDYPIYNFAGIQIKNEIRLNSRTAAWRPNVPLRQALGT